MKFIFTLIVIALAVSGIYNYFIKDSLEHIMVGGDAVSVDAGDYVVKFLLSGEFRKTYMLFGGEYFTEKSLINPIVLNGLGMVDAKNIYARYPDFYSCKSAGAAIAQPKVEDLNLIPFDEEMLGELQSTINEYQKNFSNKGDRVCVSLIGKTLSMKSAEVPGQNIDFKDQLPSRTFYLVNSSQRVNCKNLLEK